MANLNPSRDDDDTANLLAQAFAHGDERVLDLLRAAIVQAGFLCYPGPDAAMADLIAALDLPESVLIVVTNIGDAEPGDRDYRSGVLPTKLGRMPSGCWGSLPDIERARALGWTDDAIEAALKRATASQEPRPVDVAPMPDKRASDAPAPPEPDVSVLEHVINFGSAKRARKQPGIRLSDGLTWEG